MNSHDDTQELLDYLDGTLSSQEKESVLDRMQQDPALRREYETLAALARGLEEMPDEPVPAGFVDQFMATHAQPSFSEKLAAFFQTFRSPATASLALAGGLAAVALFVMPGSGSQGGDAKPLAGCTLVAQAGLASINGEDRAGEVELHLEDTVEVDDTFEGELRYPDGTTIKLSAGTAVQVRSRGLRLRQGGVWLEVTKDLKGFQVETPLALAAVKGTQFTVEYDGERTEVYVTEGLVEVSSEKNKKLLSAGKGATVDDERLVIPTTSRTPHSMFADQAEGGFRLGDE